MLRRQLDYNYFFNVLLVDKSIFILSFSTSLGKAFYFGEFELNLN